MSLSKFQRATSWNVEVYSGSWRIAGVYQGADLLHVADIAHELDLCLVFDKPDDDAAAPWQPALLLRGTMPSSLIVLDRQDDSPFPTPTPDEIRHCYEYVFHSSECALREDPHSLEGMQHLPVAVCIAANGTQIPVSNAQVCRNDGSTHTTWRSALGR